MLLSVTASVSMSTVPYAQIPLVDNEQARDDNKEELGKEDDALSLLRTALLPGPGHGSFLCLDDAHASSAALACLEPLDGRMHSLELGVARSNAAPLAQIDAVQPLIENDCSALSTIVAVSPAATSSSLKS